MTPRTDSDRRADAVACVLLIVFAVVAWFTSGCGASPAVRLGYAATVERCVASERAIVDRHSTTEEADRADLAALRAECDATLAAIGGPR